MIYTFYSYKGGVGRTMALANVAELFFQVGLKVLMVDWDLEAPGLERFFQVNIEEILDRRGIVDMLLDYKAQMSDEWPEDSTLPFLKPTELILDIYPNDKKEGKLWLITAGKRSESHLTDYTNAVLTFDWQDFYANWDGELYIEWLRKQFEEIADVVLIDSRTGLTEMGGVCTYQLADAVVMFCAANQQNIEGIYNMANNLKQPGLIEFRRGRSLEVMPIPARIEDRAERDLLNNFRNQFVDKFDEFLSEGLKTELDSLWDLKIPYVPYYAFNEIIAVLEQDKTRSEDMVLAFNKLKEVLQVIRYSKLASDQPSLLLNELLAYFVRIDYRNNKDAVIRLASLVEKFREYFEPLDEFLTASQYVRGMESWARGNHEDATITFSRIVNKEQDVQIGKVRLPVPEEILHSQVKESDEPTLEDKQRRVSSSIQKTGIPVETVRELQQWRNHLSHSPPSTLDTSTILEIEEYLHNLHRQIRNKARERKLIEVVKRALVIASYLSHSIKSGQQSKQEFYDGILQLRELLEVLVIYAERERV